MHMVVKSVSSCALLKILNIGGTYACMIRKNNGGKSSSQGFTFCISLIVSFHKYIRLYESVMGRYEQNDTICLGPM